MIQFRKLTAVLCTVCLLLTCFAGLQASADRAPGQYTGKLAGMGLNENGYFQITRELAKCEPMGEENTWTIFVYLCGSNLETDDGSATSDLQEMIDGSKGSSVRYVVLTGGALEWQNKLVDSSILEIYLVEDGVISRVNYDSYNYMNDPNTLYAFLSWSVANYPADKMGLVVWDHGGGSVNGVCIDEWFSHDIDTGVLEDISGYSDTLTLPLLSEALGKVYDEMTDQFEFIGFDACLMGSFETAFMLSSYARYMYASEETESCYGWDYVAIGQAIGQSGEIGGAELGKVVADSFYDSCVAVEREENATLSCIDLSKMDDLALEFDAFAADMLRAAEEPSSLAAIRQNTKHVEFFGNNSQTEGYHNMVDMASMIHAVAPVAGSSDAVLDALEQAVVYSRSGIHHRDACGLSVYYPLHVQSGSSDLSKYAKAACSPYYYGYVAQTAYAAAYGGIEGYDLAVSLSAWDSTIDADTELIVEDYGGAQVTGESPYVIFYDEPHLTNGGTYGFVLEDVTIPYIASVEAVIYFVSDDGEDLILLGSTTDVISNWETGVFLDNFDGMWFCTPDDQLISAIVIYETEDYAVYTTPVLLNGEETNLRFVVDLEDYTVTLDGVWDDVDEYGLAGRGSTQLQVGDVIQPIFMAFSLDSDDEFNYYGEEYVYDGSSTWYYTELHDAMYTYMFYINDVYGDYYATDSVIFTVEDGEIHFDLN